MGLFSEPHGCPSAAAADSLVSGAGGGGRWKTSRSGSHASFGDTRGINDALVSGVLKSGAGCMLLACWQAAQLEPCSGECSLLMRKPQPGLCKPVHERCKSHPFVMRHSMNTSTHHPTLNSVEEVSSWRQPRHLKGAGIARSACTHPSQLHRQLPAGLHTWGRSAGCRPRMVQRASSSTRSASTSGAASRMLRSSSADSASLSWPAQDHRPALRVWAGCGAGAPDVAWPASQGLYAPYFKDGYDFRHAGWHHCCSLRSVLERLACTDATAGDAGDNTEHSWHAQLRVWQ